MTAAVEDAGHEDVIGLDDEEDDVMEAREDGTTSAAGVNGEGLGICGNAIEEHAELRIELPPQAGFPGLVPVNSFVDVAPDFVAVADYHPCLRFSPA